MRHRQAIDLLPELTAGTLRAATRAPLEEHLAECEECRGWVETYRFFSEALGGRVETAAGEHLPSEDLARWAVGQNATPGSARSHLEQCPACERELDWTRRAITRARGGGPGGLEVLARAIATPPRRLALAASLLLVALSATWVLSRSGGLGRASHDISSRRLAGSQEITARESIRATGVWIESGSEIRFSAGETVALGEGFVVGPDAVFTVETTGWKLPDGGTQRDQR